MKKSLIIILIVQYIMVSCGTSHKREVISLTETFFNYASEGKINSLSMLYPNFDKEYFTMFQIQSDSIKIQSIMEENDKFFVQLENFYSHDNSKRNSKSYNITLEIKQKKSKKEGRKFYIDDSKGIIKKNSITNYAYETGCLNLSRKYNDIEIIKRLKILDIILDTKATEVSKLLNSSVEIHLQLERIWDNFSCYIVNDNMIFFTLSNPTQYNCSNFEVLFLLKNIWSGNKQGEVKGFFNDLEAKSIQNYYLQFSDDEIKKDDSGYKPYALPVKFYISKEAVKKYTKLDFSGNEYEEYIKSVKNGPITKNDTTSVRNHKKEEQEEIIWGIQVLSTDEKLDNTSPKLKGVPAKRYNYGDTYKYIYGSFKKREECLKELKSIREKVSDAFPTQVYISKLDE